MKKRDDYKLVKYAMNGGLNGAALGAAFSDKKENTFSAAVIGAALGATCVAFSEAEANKIPIVYKDEEGNLWRKVGEKKTLIKKIERIKSEHHFPDTFEI